MQRMLIKNIAQLLQTRITAPAWVAGKEMAQLPLIEKAWLLTEGPVISGFGTMDSCPEWSGETFDASGRTVMPAFCDSHTHLVYTGSRELEYVDKIKGLSYEEIAQRGGGINNSAKRLQLVSEEQLFDESMVRIHEIIGFGTGAVEIKSGYGLTTEAELKMLRVIRRIKENTPLIIRSTFLGAHTIPTEYKNRKDDYVNLVIDDMLPRVAGEKLADFVDVFCDRGFFSQYDTSRILEAAAKYGLIPKIHANELDYSGGIQTGVEHGALSVDHLECTGDEEINILKNSITIPTLLPGAAFFLNMSWPPARKMIDAGLPVALASDYNPGSSPSGNRKMILSLACISLRMLPEEAINAATINSAYAMGIEKLAGSITPGKRANLIITKPIPGYAFLPYAYGSNLVEKTILNGKIYT